MVSDRHTALVTVLMPCYNALPYLHEALNSIIDQTYQNLEILCINDGSTDSTGVVLNEYAAKDSRIKVIHNEQNIKLIGTLNKGIQLAKGEFIARMDSDDISVKNRIEKLLDFLKSTNSDVVSCNFDVINEKSKKIKANLLRAYSHQEILSSSFLFTPILHAGLLAKRDVFLQFSYSYESSSLHVEDYELWCRMLRNGVKFQNSSEVLYYVRMNQESVSHQYESVQKENFATCALNHYNEAFNKKLSYDEYCIVANRFEKITHTQLKNAFSIIEGIENISIKIVKTQKLDVLINAIRIVKGKEKFYYYFQLAKLLLTSLNNYFIVKYIRTKF